MTKPKFRIALCSVCGKPMNKNGKVHDQCHTISSGDNALNIKFLAARAIERMRKEQAKTVKHWHVGMGFKVLAKMFPDMQDRVGMGADEYYRA